MHADETLWTIKAQALRNKYAVYMPQIPDIIAEINEILETVAKLTSLNSLAC